MNYKQWIFGRTATKHDIRFRRTISTLRNLIEGKTDTQSRKLIREYKEHNNIANPYLREAKDRVIEILDKTKDLQESIKEKKTTVKKVKVDNTEDTIITTGL